MNLLPDDFWDDFENEGGWPQFAVAALVFAFVIAAMFGVLVVASAVLP